MEVQITVIRGVEFGGLTLSPRYRLILATRGDATPIGVSSCVLLRYARRPYAVAHLRLTQAIEGAGGMLPAEKRLRIFLADTLESPNASPPGGLTLTYKALTQEHEAARKLKKEGEILVCLGNPPYDRQQSEAGTEASAHRKGGWVRFGDQLKGGAKQEEQGERPIFTDFIEPASRAGAGVHLKNLYNDYVYFWRWALWRLLNNRNVAGY